ncbi:MAG: lipoate--protein ligase family protein [Planctomycetota bacterium]|jgi:lipoate-protein ligase A
MHFHEHTSSEPAENLAWDEALLEGAEQHMGSESGAVREVLRVWEMPRACVVVGRASRLDQEVFVERCCEDRIPILRRMSGGSSIVAGPGCLMYSVLLSLEERPTCRQVDAAHRTVMERTRLAVQRTLHRFSIQGDVAIEGICDLTWNGYKISGNALRVKRHWLMYHGTILLTMPLEWIERYLRIPPRQPDYRAGRAHERFVTSLRSAIERYPEFPSQLSRELAIAWNATLPWSDHPLANSVAGLAREWMDRRYCDSTWHRGREGTQ